MHPSSSFFSSQQHIFIQWFHFLLKFLLLLSFLQSKPRSHQTNMCFVHTYIVCMYVCMYTLHTHTHTIYACSYTAWSFPNFFNFTWVDGSSFFSPLLGAKVVPPNVIHRTDCFLTTAVKKRCLLLKVFGTELLRGLPWEIRDWCEWVNLEQMKLGHYTWKDGFRVNGNVLLGMFFVVVALRKTNKHLK